MSVRDVSPSEPRRRILVADDSPLFREVATVFLGRCAEVVCARDGAQALESTRREPYDVVVAEVSMREMSGDELCRRLRRDPDLERLPVILVTNGSAEEHEIAVLAGADDVVEKPLDRVTLVQAVNRFLRLTVRGLPRAPLETEVLLSTPTLEIHSRARNVSRGGIFVEDAPPLEPNTEVALEFTLPESPIPIQSTARVVWRRPPDEEHPGGLGLQFLKLERDLSEQLSRYVFELAKPEDLNFLL